MRINYYFSTMSPFTYLAGTSLEQIAARHGTAITYRPLDIMGLFARTGGQPPAERHPNRQAYRVQDLARSAAIAGMEVILKPRLSRPTRRPPPTRSSRRRPRAAETWAGSFTRFCVRSRPSRRTSPTRR